MMNSKISALVSLASLLALSFAVPACGGEVAAEDASKEPTQQRDDRITSEGLTITFQDGMHVKGTFERRARRLAFDLDATDGGHTARIFDDKGAAIIDSKLENGVEETMLLGGLAQVRGTVGALEPDVQADQATLEKLAKNPDVQLVPELKEALRVRGVDGAFFSANPTTTKTAGGVNPQSWLDVWGTWHLNTWESVDLPTWSFWGTTTFEFSASGSTNAKLQVLTPWYNPPEYTGYFTGTIVVRRQYAGYRARVTNVGVWGPELRVRAY